MTAPSLSRNPLTDVCWAIPQLDALRLTALQKMNSVLIHEDQLDEVQDDMTLLSFRAEQRSQLAQVLRVDSTAHVDDELSVLVPGNPEHLSFPRDFAGIAAKARPSPECMASPTPRQTD
ncbi:MAG TPA: hypothetical protein VKE51_26215 [Vicinamibacterales bacterium]|nr:hypothetical protein [Vicinamibacterales bacterium]